MLSWEKYVAMCEDHAETLCRVTRLKHGLNPDVGVDCQGEPCRCVCPFIETEEEDVDVDAEATTNYYRECCL